jgi:PAS domain S-box-containing protein
MSADPLPGLGSEHEALIQFLYLAPVGLVQTGMDGTVSLINPLSVQLLMPLAPAACMNNLFDALETVAPDLRQLCAAFAAPNGMICQGRQIVLQQDAATPVKRGTPEVLSISVLKLDANRLMAVLQDVTEQVRRERLLRQSDAMIDAILTNISDYAVVSLDRRGHVSDWNDSIGRVTGFGPELVGAPYSVFYPGGATTDDGQLARLRDVVAHGWQLEQGTRMRADGSQFWSSAMIAPLPVSSVLHEGEPDTAYCMILRDISARHAAEQTTAPDQAPTTNALPR